MRRRDLVLAAACEAPHAPVDELKLNRFVGEYNEYVQRLMRGQLDLKQWVRVVRAWESLK
jgi:hypothetical protein